MSEVDFLIVEDLVAAAQAAVGEHVVVADYGLLSSACARPQATVFGEDAYPGLDGKAAALLSSLVRNHALVDGNKRLGWTATRLFLRLNGADVNAGEDEAYDLVLAIADGTMVDVGKIAASLRSWMISLPAGA